MPRGRPKGSKNLNGYQKGRAKRIRGILADKGITHFDRFKDGELVNSFAFNPNGDLFIRLEFFSMAMKQYERVSEIAEETSEYLNSQHKELLGLQKMNQRLIR
jgi:hypothetical protein